MPEAFPVPGRDATLDRKAVDDAGCETARWVTLAGMTLHTYEFRDPEALLVELAARVPFTEDTAYLVLVAHPSTEQRIVRVERLDVQPSSTAGKMRGTRCTSGSSPGLFPTWCPLPMPAC